jgi:aminobenzoyl-glutamate transport protein
MEQVPDAAASNSRISQKFLDVIEWAGNKLPDPAFLFVLALLITCLVSKALAPVEFTEKDPRTDKPLKVVDQLSPVSLAGLLSGMVKTFVDFPPLGVVLVALLGVGVAEHTGFIQALLKAMLKLTPRFLLTPMLLLVAIMSHSAGDTGYVLIIPLGGVMFAAAGRHPVAGICTAFAGVSGGFSANFMPSSLDPLLQGFTQKAAQIISPTSEINPLCNWGFMSLSCLVIVAVGWYITDFVIEPRLARLPLDGDAGDSSSMHHMHATEVRGLAAGLAVLVVGLVVLFAVSLPSDSVMRAPNGDLTTHDAPLMKSIVPLIFLLFLLPGIVHGYVAGTVKSHRDIVQGMTKSMGTINYYLVMAFFAAQFTAVFASSNVGVLLAIKGANALEAMKLPGQVTIIGVILLTTGVNLLIGSASAKWALLSPIFVPMLMRLGISPELTQAAYRIGDSSTNIVTPLMPYFPLVVVYAQRYAKNTGIGTMISLMVAYSLTFLVTWTVLLLVYWGLGIPLGLNAGYTWP